MYKLKNLNYDYDSLEPFIDTHTLGLHRNKHQQGYLNKLNNLLIKNHYDFKYQIEELPNHIMEFNSMDHNDIMFNLGGVLNHNIYFNSMSSNKIEPNIILKKMIENTFQTVEELKNKMKEQALLLQGSGYIFLVLDQNNLKIITLNNQETPYYYGYIPLIALDMWEHAYYLNYKNNKSEYIDNFFSVLDFQFANEQVMKNQ